MATFIARKSNHIQEDIKRNWSSWNFGQEGFTGDIEDLEKLFQSAIDEESSVWISGFDIWVESVDVDYSNRIVYANDFKIKELYSGYWVAVDSINAENGLSCISLDADNKEDAILEAEKRTDYFGDGDSFNTNEAKLIYSNDDIHVFELND